MSLKVFHAVFIFFSCISGVGMFVWGLNDFLASRSAMNLALAILGLALSVGLAFYGAWFWRNKLKDVDFF
jgi:hypothetical protein